MEGSYWYHFQVHGRENVGLNHTIKQLNADQSYGTPHYSAPLQQKQDRISASPQVHFTRIFNH